MSATLSTASGEVPAVVVGTCAHSLATIRALARGGVVVHALGESRRHPAWRSRYGTFHTIASFQGEALVDALIAFRRRVLPEVRPVLIVTNDQMVQAVAARAGTIAEHYRLSWAGEADVVAGLTLKSGVESRCQDVGLDFPHTLTIAGLEDLEHLVRIPDWPVIVKPNRPLSGFKTGIVLSPSDLCAFVERHKADLPVIVQEWIPGDDTAIHFSAAYLANGRVLARFDGRKLRSYPMGHTTIAEPLPADDVHAAMVRFFAGLGLTGPASLEVKRRPDGRLVVIEPTVGRTDAWLDLCIANGVNLPMVEYAEQTGGTWPTRGGTVLWLNAERDLFGLPWLLLNLAKASRLPGGIRFTYFDWRDPLPFLRATAIMLRGLPVRICRTVARRLRRQ